MKSSFELLKSLITKIISGTNLDNEKESIIFFLLMIALKKIHLIFGSKNIEMMKFTQNTILPWI